MGLVSQVFNEGVLSSLQGEIAVGHNRYSTTGSSKACNAQPILCESSDGIMALAHNGTSSTRCKSATRWKRRARNSKLRWTPEVLCKLIESGNKMPLEDALLAMMERVSGAILW
jgi:amidophosphoribosyltransferase